MIPYRAQAPLLFKRIPVLAVTDDDERDFAASGVITFGGGRHGAARRESAVRYLAGD